MSVVSLLATWMRRKKRSSSDSGSKGGQPLRVVAKLLWLMEEGWLTAPHYMADKDGIDPLYTILANT